METGSVAVTLVIAVWGVLEYQKRERHHKDLLACLEQGHYGRPQASSPSMGKLLGEALLTILLAAVSVLMFGAGLREDFSGPVLYGMAALFSAMMVIVALMLVRDVRRRGSTSHTSRAEKP
jgi:hypothetical protein